MTDYRGLARESADHGLRVAGDLADSLARKRLRPGLRVGDGLRVVGPARLHRRVACLLEQISPAVPAAREQPEPMDEHDRLLAGLVGAGYLRRLASRRGGRHVPHHLERIEAAW